MTALSFLNSLRSDRPVTIFLPSLASGGAERSMIAVANGLSSRGANITLVLGNAIGPYIDEIRSGIRVVNLRADSAPRSLPGLVRHLRSCRPATLLSSMSHANVVVSVAHWISGSAAQLVLSERSHLSSSLTEYGGLGMRIVRTLMPMTYARADRIVAVSCAVAKDLTNHLPVIRDRIVTIYNPIVSEDLHRLAAAPTSHPWLSSSQIPVILAVGRLTPLKDFATLIDAFSLLRRTRPLRLLILGEGELRQNLLTQAARLGVAEDVALPGFDPNPFAAMRASSVFVVSSRYEGLPGALIQAMACGTRVVCTEGPGGSREVLEDGRWGRLVPVGDAIAMARAISATLDDPSPPDVRGRAAAFSEESALYRYAEVMGLLCSPSRDG